MSYSKNKTTHYECILIDEDERMDGKAEYYLTGQKTLFQIGLLRPNTLQREDSPNLPASEKMEEVGE